MKSLLAGGATAVLLLAGVVSAAPAQADSSTIHVSSATSPFGDGLVDITGTYQCDSPTFPGVEVDVTQNGNTGTTRLVNGDQCDGTSRSFDIELFNQQFVDGEATYHACLLDTGNQNPSPTPSDCPLDTSNNVQLASEDGDVMITTPPFSAVNNLKDTNITTDTITLSWSPPTQTGDRPIEDYQMTLQGPASRLFNFQTTDTTFTFQNLRPTTPYTMTVRALNDLSVKGPPATIKASTIKPASPPPPPPPPPPRHHHPSRIRLHVTIHTTHHHVRPTHLDVIHGRVRPHHRVQVELQRRVQGVWVVANSGSRRASASGRYHFEIRPVTKFVCRVVILSTKKFKASHSKKVVIHIKH